MKRIIGILLLSLAFTMPAHPGEPTYGTKDNPGLIDDPGCKILIRNQLRDNKEDPKNFTVTFYDSKKGDGAVMNAYVITDKRTRKQVFAVIGLSFGPLPSGSPSESPTPSPSPSPTPTPAGLITTHV
jgi:hypothetical protein